MQYFIYNEFDQKGLPGSGKEFMDYVFLSNLDTLRGKCEFPFIVSSGYRSPEYNNKVSSTGFTGPHTTGKAADILVSRSKARILLREALNMLCFEGIGVSQKGEHRYIHLDMVQREENALWSY